MQRRQPTADMTGKSAAGGRSAWRSAWITSSIVARMLALVGSAVYAYAVYAPWLTASVRFPQDGGIGLPPLPTLSGSRAVELLPTSRLPDAIFGFSLLSVLGLLLAPCLWASAGSALGRVARWAFALWVALAALVAGLLAWTLFLDSSWLRFYGVTATDRTPSWGLFLTVLALVALAVAAVALLRERSPDAPETTAPDPWTRAAIAGAALLSLGALAWGVGFLALPWVSTGCTTAPLTLNHFAFGSCAGLDAGDVLGYVPQPGLSSVAAALANPVLAVYVLLTSGTLVALGVVAHAAWLRRLPVPLVQRWIAVWLAAASVVAAFAVSGVAVVMAARPNISSAAASEVWHADMGLLFSLLGLILAWVGLALLGIPGGVRPSGAGLAGRAGAQPGRGGEGAGVSSARG